MARRSRVGANDAANSGSSYMCTLTPASTAVAARAWAPLPPPRTAIVARVPLSVVIALFILPQGAIAEAEPSRTPRKAIFPGYGVWVGPKSLIPAPLGACRAAGGRLMRRFARPGGGCASSAGRRSARARGGAGGPGSFDISTQKVIADQDGDPQASRAGINREDPDGCHGVATR